MTVDKAMNLEAQLILTMDQKVFANPRRMALLAAIAEAGSVSQGAKQAGMSYKAAWDAVKDMNQRAKSRCSPWLWAAKAVVVPS